VTLIIGVLGRARHGKSTACEAIAERVKQEGLKTKFFDIGDKVRLYCIENNLLPKVDRKDMTAEQLKILVDVGKQKRKENKEFWIGPLIEDLRASKNIDVAFFPNIRHKNEADHVKEEGGYIIGCKRYNEDGSLFISPDRPANDESETGMRFIIPDYYINTKTGENVLVEKLAVTIFEHIKGEHARRTTTA